MDPIAHFHFVFAVLNKGLSVSVWYDLRRGVGMCTYQNRQNAERNRFCFSVEKVGRVNIQGNKVRISS
jgi:hypothetical protein